MRIKTLCYILVVPLISKHIVCNLEKNNEINFFITFPFLLGFWSYMSFSSKASSNYFSFILFSLLLFHFLVIFTLVIARMSWIMNWEICSYIGFYIWTCHWNWFHPFIYLHLSFLIYKIKGTTLIIHISKWTSESCDYHFSIHNQELG